MISGDRSGRSGHSGAQHGYREHAEGAEPCAKDPVQCRHCLQHAVEFQATTDRNQGRLLLLGPVQPVLWTGTVEKEINLRCKLTEFVILGDFFEISFSENPILMVNIQ